MMTTQRYQELAAQRQEFKRMEEEAKLLKEAIEAEIKAAMLEQDKDLIFAGPFKISWKAQERNIIDSTRLKKEHEEIYLTYVKPVSCRPFQIN